MTDDTADLQARIAFLDDDVKTLRDSVDAHQQQILALENLCSVLAERLATVIEGSAESAGSAPDERPPHY
ncbi:MAG: SlyX family protein [Pseudomonadota bacterium]